eukprot:12301654-Ditylum_brightwellii.AAC.1
MHYGDGFLKEEIARLEKARKRAAEASDRFNSFEYESPLGQGFSFTGAPKEGNPYSKKPQGPPKNQSYTIEYEESHFYETDGTKLKDGFTGGAKRVVRAKETVKGRMEERRQNRVRRDGGVRGGQNRQRQQQRYQEEEGCVVM